MLTDVLTVVLTVETLTSWRAFRIVRKARQPQLFAMKIEGNNVPAFLVVL